MGFPSGTMVRICLPMQDPWVGKILWSRKWQPIPVFLPGKSHRQRSLAGYSPWDCKESGMTERLSTHLFTELHQVLGVAGRILRCGTPTLSCSMWDLVPWPGIKPVPPQLGVWCLKHWTTREVPPIVFLRMKKDCKSKVCEPLFQGTTCSLEIGVSWNILKEGTMSLGWWPWWKSQEEK